MYPNGPLRSMKMSLALDAYDLRSPTLKFKRTFTLAARTSAADLSKVERTFIAV